MFSRRLVALFALFSLAASAPHRDHAGPCDEAPVSVTSPSPTPVVPTSVIPTPTPTPTPTTTTTTTTSSAAPSPAPAAVAIASPSDDTVYSGGFATYFYQNGNPGACGQVNPDSALICALDQDTFGTSGPDSPYCGRQVQITNTENGQSVTVTIVDDCPTCDNAQSIDLSVGAFEAIADLSTGIVPITWYFV